jgi:hypothetical protein
MDSRDPIRGLFFILVLLRQANSAVQNDFDQSRAGPEAKDALVKAVFGYAYRVHLYSQTKILSPVGAASGSRSIRRTRDAVRQFTIIARGQEGSNFGLAW